MVQSTAETSRALAKTISDLGKNLVTLSEIILQQATNVSSASSHIEEDEDKKSKKKKKAEKDPNAPKRNLSSYMLFSQAVRPETVAEHPELKAVDVAKLIGEKWNALSDKEKQPFIKQAEKEKQRFDKETLHYKALFDSDDSQPDTNDTVNTKRKNNEDASSSTENKKKVKKETDPKKKSKKKN